MHDVSERCKVVFHIWDAVTLIFFNRGWQKKKKKDKTPAAS